MKLTLLEKMEGAKGERVRPLVECPGCGRRYRPDDALITFDCFVCHGLEADARRARVELEEMIAAADLPTVRRILATLEGDNWRMEIDSYLCYARLDQLAAMGIDTGGAQ